MDFIPTAVAVRGHPITVLEEAGLLHRDADVFRQNRAAYRITEPLIGFYHAIMRPDFACGAE